MRRAVIVALQLWGWVWEGIALSSTEAGAIRIFCDTKNTVRCNNYYAWEDQRRKRCYIVHVAPRGVNSAILSVNITRYAYGNEPEGFQKVDLSPFGAG